MNKNYLLIGTMLLLLATTSSAQIKLVQPTAGSIIYVTTYEKQLIEQEITVRNTGPQTIQDITPQTTLANVVFTSPNFGLGPDQNKTLTATILATQNEQGTITIGNQSFQVKIHITENKQTTDLLLEQIEKNKTLIYLTMFITSFLVILLTMRRAT